MPVPAVQILIDSAPDLHFDYAIPDELVGKVLVGCRVRVPLRNKTALGTVVRVHELDDDDPLARKLKPIVDLTDPKPVITGPLLRLADWISEYYITPLEAVFRTMLPLAVRQGDQGEQLRKMVKLLRHPGEEELQKIGRRAPRQGAILEHLSQLEPPQALITQLEETLAINRASVEGLVKGGWVEVVDEAVARDPYGDETYLQSHPLELNAEQKVVMDGVVEALDGFGGETAPLPMLLHGVTGSGKTEVYLQAIQTVLDRGQGAIVLVPEISLTPQTADRFKQRFAHIQDQVAILHSHLSHGERHDEWRKVMRRKARIVIGARSAIFAPVENLGLIVVDEEHEHSYKQESPPRYHARDVSVVRAHLEKCAVLLGSATPSLESWRNTLTGKYRLLTMKQRVDNQTLPLIRILDMRQEGRRLDQKSGPAILSIKLRQEMESRLATGEQIILFLNRRGFARSLLCPECGYVAHCRHCALPMTFHQGDNRLVCHLCGYAQISPRRCPECQGQAIALAGYGTERVEEVMRKVFPKARMARVDTDTMRRKNQLRETLDAFKAKKIDILIGTQMIAKGLHFPNVTLVGVLNADIGLNIADFRAGERTFQLLTQVAGRAGRGELEGSVVVQTFTPHHPAIQFSRHHDFEGFADQELDLRERVIFPPYCHLAMVTVRSVHQERAEFSLKTLHRRLAANLPKEISLTEPLPSPLVKSHDQFRFQVTLRAKQARKIAAHVRHILSGLTFPEDVIVTVDMDAYNLS